MNTYGSQSTIKYKKNKRRGMNKKQGKKVDWLTIILFVILVVVVIIFFGK
jgi:hypothetical protein